MSGNSLDGPPESGRTDISQPHTEGWNNKQGSDIHNKQRFDMPNQQGSGIDSKSLDLVSSMKFPGGPANLKKEMDRIENNIFTTEKLTPEEKQARRMLIAGGVLSSILSGGVAMGISTLVSMKAAPVILSLGGTTTALCAVCGAIGGAGFGAWSAVKFGSSLHGKYPGPAGCALAAVIIGVGVPLGIGAGAAGGALTAAGVGGLSATFLMAQAVGFGAFKASLTILEPLAEHTIGKGFARLAQGKLDEARQKQTTEVGGLSPKEKEQGFKKLEQFCKTPFTYSSNYSYQNIFSPPIHEQVRGLLYRDDPPKQGIQGMAEKMERGVTNAFHRATGQTFNRSLDKEASKTLFDTINEITRQGKFENAAQAWENFDQAERRCRNSGIHEQIKQVKEEITKNYGARPGALEICTCGLYSKGRFPKTV